MNTDYQHSATKPSENTYSIQSISEDAIVIAVGDHLDFRNTTDFKNMLKDQFDAGTRTFILDFSKTISFDSTGLGSLFTLYRRLAKVSGVIYFASTSKVVKNAVDLTGTYKVFRQFASIEDAQCAAGI